MTEKELFELLGELLPVQDTLNDQTYAKNHGTELPSVANQRAHDTVRRWLDRGDGVAVYRNEAMDSSNFGHRKFVSYGSPIAQIEEDEPPKRLPDIGNQINWAYQLEATVRRENDAEVG